MLAARRKRSKHDVDRSIGTATSTSGRKKSRSFPVRRRKLSPKRDEDAANSLASLGPTGTRQLVEFGVAHGDDAFTKVDVAQRQSEGFADAQATAVKQQEQHSIHRRPAMGYGPLAKPRLPQPVAAARRWSIRKGIAGAAAWVWSSAMATCEHGHGRWQIGRPPTAPCISGARWR